jgi:hypothetical protein
MQRIDVIDEKIHYAAHDAVATEGGKMNPNTVAGDAHVAWIGLNAVWPV